MRMPEDFQLGTSGRVQSMLALLESLCATYACTRFVDVSQLGACMTAAAHMALPERTMHRGSLDMLKCRLLVAGADG